MNSDSMATDHIATALRREIARTTLHDFRSYTDLCCSVFVYPARSSKQAFSDNGQSLGQHRYYIDVKDGVQKPLYVKVNSAGQIRIHYLGEWNHVSRLIKDLLPPPTHNQETPWSIEEQNRQWMLLHKWWKANGKSFRLLDLALEIREVIYGFALALRAEPYPYARCRKRSDAVAGIIARNNPNVKLLESNRQVYAEAGHIMFRDALFFAEHVGVLRKIGKNMTLCRNLANLELALPHEDYFRLFGVVFWEELDDKALQRDIEAVRTLRCLRLKRLVFQILPARKVSTVDGLDRCCLKTIVDWIFVGAFQWVKGHPVKVTGWAKTNQKQDLEARCADARNEYLQWCEAKPLGFVEGTMDEWDEYMDQDDGGVRLDGVVEEVAKTGHDTEIERKRSPKCQCEPKCEWVSWSPDG